VPAKSRRGSAWGAGRQDRVEPADERDARGDSWFVDFDPVRAKLDGRRPTGPDPVIAPLSPNEFEDSALGPIPKGWSVGKVSDMCSTQYGYTASATDQLIGPHFLRVMDINKEHWIDWNSVPHCVIPEDDKARYALSVGDIVVARMADPGKSAIVEQKIDAVFASYLVRLKTETLAHAYYLYYYLKSPAYTEYTAGAMSGSVQANMNAKVIVAAELLMPPVPILIAFTDTILPFRQQIVANLNQSRSLATIRDTLLPRLLSGQVRITNCVAA
jgi:type I restriction enzyme, S subunit